MANFLDRTKRYLEEFDYTDAARAFGTNPQQNAQKIRTHMMTDPRLTEQNVRENNRSGIRPATERNTVNSDNTNRQTGGYGTTPYMQQLNSLYDQIMNRKPFQYDLNGDLLYRQMADRYTQLGQQAMRDAMGQASALTGGYGNSYAQQVGNQAHQQYLTYLNEQIPSLYDRAYGVWQDEGDRLLEEYQLTAAHPGYLAAMQPSTGGGRTTSAEEDGAQGTGGNFLAALETNNIFNALMRDPVQDAEAVEDTNENPVNTTVNPPVQYDPSANPLSYIYRRNRLGR